MVTGNNIAGEWSVAYAVSIKRLDSQFMLCLLRLMTWPNLNNMHGDLVDDLRLICSLLAKRPMVGFLIARRLKLPVDKTYALLSVLESEGHIHAVGANLMDVNLDALDNAKALNAKVPTVSQTASLEGIEKLSITTSEQRVLKLNEATLQSTKSAVNLADGHATTTELILEHENGRVSADQLGSGDVLNQLWRVLNTDIVMTKAARAKMDTEGSAVKEAGDVLSQLWNVLNTDIGAKSENIDKSAAKASPRSKTKVAKSGRDEKIADKDISIVLKDVNGQDIDPELVEKSLENETKDVMGQLWSVLNTDIAFKRQTATEADIATDIQPNNAKTKEVAEVMSQLWRVLNTEIATKRQDSTKGKSESLSDTTREANDKLAKLWRILDSEIILKKKPTTYFMGDAPVEIAKKELKDTSGEAVARLSQLWQVLNSEIAIALPAERSSNAPKRR